MFESVKHAVFWGLLHQDLDHIEAIGVDEIQWQRGHHYLTVVYEIEEGMKRLLWVAEGRTEQSLRGFFQYLTAAGRRSIRFVCSDMCQAYLNVVAEQAGHAIHVLDRFHIMKNMNEAIDKVRREEAARLKRDGYEEVLKHSRWCLLKRRENLTDQQTVKLAELLKYNLQSVRSHLLREDFQRVLGIRQPDMGGEIPGPVVHARYAEQDRADEGGCSQLAGTSALAPQLVPRSGNGFGRFRRGAQQQSESDYQKIIRFSRLQSHRNRPISRPWQASRTKIHPRILLRKQNFCGSR